MLLKIVIPQGVDFADLDLTRDPATGEVSFAWDPIEAICEASDINIDVFRKSREDNVAALITAWYREHRQRGGTLDPVQEQLIAEVMAEDTFGAERIQATPGTKQ